jgi:carboxylate-amine ligase
VRTLGIEEELLVVDARTGEPSARSEEVIRRAHQRLEDQGDGETGRPDHKPGGHVGQELQMQQLEVDTPPRTNLADLREDLLAWRRAVASSAEDNDARLVAAGTSPLPSVTRITPDDRYRWMRERFGVTAEDQLTCGCHVHVVVEDDEEGVAVIDRVRPWLPVLLALSANSPFWQGRDSGYASFRSQSWIRWPSAGPTDVFGSAKAYRGVVDDMLASEVLLDEGMVYFDARLSPRYPTVEIRATDVCLDPVDAVLVGALCRGLVEASARSWRHGEPPSTVPTAVLRLATWQAGKSGVDGPLLDPMTGRPRPSREVIDSLVAHVGTELEATGDLAFVQEQVAEVMSRGNGARHQRRVMERTGSLAAVVKDLADASCPRG